MRIEGISRIGSGDVLANVAQVPGVYGSGLSGRPESTDGRLQNREALPGNGKTNRQLQTDELVIGSTAEIIGADGLVEAYARIRFDQESRTVLIQIVNATNDEVIREIPPSAWEKMKSNTQFLTGVLTDKQSEPESAGGAAR